VYVPSSERRVLEHFGFTQEDLPRLVITDLRATRSDISISKPENKAPVPPNGETRTYKAQPMPLSEAAMAGFLQSYLQGEVNPWLRSETVTYDDEPSTVVRLTGRTFSTTALSSEKDYFVLFYAPWCGHCSALAPVWTSLAEKFAKVDSVVVAKMDATLNEVDVPGKEASRVSTASSEGEGHWKPIVQKSHIDARTIGPEK
jgi:protein disulfide-isomerase A1